MFDINLTVRRIGPRLPWLTSCLQNGLLC